MKLTTDNAQALVIPYGPQLDMPVRWPDIGPQRDIEWQEKFNASPAWQYMPQHWYAQNHIVQVWPYPVDLLQTTGVGGLEQKPYYPADANIDFGNIYPELTPGTKTLHQLLRLR